MLRKFLSESEFLILPQCGWIIILLIGCSIILPIKGWGNKEKCQLRLYAVQEFMVSNDVINDNTPARHQRRTDKSLSTVGKL